ncbi:MAG TPA: hypothetical protein VGP08_04230 [Pyrinomonadaceae bacterium]|jgi:hypothetical protein|nr:hypothetical protein [Pyrinomonadaceae bacterium]
MKMLRAIFLISLAAGSTAAQSASDGGNLLPEKVGDFNARGKSATAARGAKALSQFKPEDFAVVAQDERTYAGADDALLLVREVKTNSASAAFSLLGRVATGESRPGFRVLPDLGLFGLAEARRTIFIKGSTLVDVQDLSPPAKNGAALRDFSKSLADSLRGESGFVPVLALHVPEWDRKLSEDLGYAVSLAALKEAAGARPALDAVSFDGGAEAVTAKYGDARLVVVEFSTPQHAFDADADITRRVEELRAAGQPVPSSYKRVGNYSVFVFDAPDSAAAENLISGVKYEKDVRWLGRNPHADENAIRNYTSKMGGVILTTLITTGLAILVCLTVGGLIGGAIFFSRRAKHAAQEIYSDAGGMLRLNIEDVNTPQTTKALGRGED